jgi:dipeptidyl aminopeptidase/acylaminoacyl peptidase
VQLADDAPPLASSPRQLNASANGSLLAYRTGAELGQQFTWVARDGRPLGPVGPEGRYTTLDLSLDGSRLIVSRVESAGMSNLWLLDVEKGTFSRVTTGAASDVDPRFSPDGRAVIFGSNRDPSRSPYRASVVGEQPAPLFKFPGRLYSNDDWSADGRWLLYHDATDPVLYARRLDRLDDPPLVVARALVGVIDEAQMSFDGKWVAYNSTESGRAEVYVVPFPPTGDRWQVSVAGGAQPLWRQDDRELYFLGPDGALLAASVTPGPRFEAHTPVRLFQSPVRAVTFATEQYAAVPDGSKFLFPAFAADARPDSIVVVSNWRSLLDASGQ